jgi:uncharacterized linocin/CFP29 family protein
MSNNLGRDRLEDWDQAIWSRIDTEVSNETSRTRVGAKFIHICKIVDPTARTVAADAITPPAAAVAPPAAAVAPPAAAVAPPAAAVAPPAAAAGPLEIDQANELPITEDSVSFRLTQQQYADEQRLGTAATLATRAANVLAGRMGETIFGPPNLVDLAAAANPVLAVGHRAGGGYGNRTFAEVANAYAQLQGQRHYGPYALVMSANEYADAHAPLKKTLIMPADRIRALTDKGFYGTGTLPDQTALMISTGGNTLDLAISVDPVTAFVQIEGDNIYRFRVYHRFALRVKDPSALVLLQFV